MIDLKGHAALITGSTRGVGKAIAEAFAQAGADVIIHGLEPGAEADAIIARCRSFGVRCDFLAADLTGEIEPTVQKLCDDALARLPKLDILVNNAGQFFDVAFEDMTVERFERTLRLNVTSGYFLTRQFARHWIASGTPARVLFTGSINGRLAEAGSTAYDTSKGAVEMMVKTLAVALAPHKIRVNGLAPGLVRTPQTAWIDSRPKQAQWVQAHTPDGTIPDAAVCAPGAVYLCSDAAEHVHGHMLMIDGGMSAWQHPPAPSP